jgi:hypothetical protein
MMRSWRILFSRGIPKRNLDFRRFDSHHQFHSSLHLDDHHSFCRDSITTGFSLLQNRCQTTNINRGTVYSERNSLNINVLVQSLMEDLRKGDFRNFDSNRRLLLPKAGISSKIALTQEQTQRLTLCLKEWNNQDHSLKEYPSVLKFMAVLKFSALNEAQKEIIVAIVDKFLKKKQQSFYWFALFLSGLRGLNYSGALLKSNHRQRILESLSELNEGNDGRAYSDLLIGIGGLRISWKDYCEAGQRNLLNQLESVKETLDARSICTVIFNYGKLGANLKETGHKKIVIELVEKGLKEIDDDIGKGKLDLSREVS